MQRENKNVNYVLATMGILVSIILGTLNGSWSIPRIIIFVVYLLITMISGVYSEE